LYGNAGEDHGEILVSVSNRTTTGDVDPSLFLTAQASADVIDSLLYYAVIPSEGWSDITIGNMDIGDRFLEITRLDVYGLETRNEPDNRSGAFSRCSTSCSLLIHALLAAHCPARFLRLQVRNSRHRVALQTLVVHKLQSSVVS